MGILWVPFLLGLALYAGGSVWGIGYLISPPRFAPGFAKKLAIGGWLLQGLFLVMEGIKTRNFPAGTLLDSLVLFSWCAILLYLIFDRFTMLEALPSFFLPVATVVSIAAIFFVDRNPPSQEPLSSFWLALHAGFAFLGCGAFTVGFATSVMYLLQEKQLKAKHVGSLFQRLPSLEVLDRVNYRAITSGFPLFTLAIITGIIWGQSSNIWAKRPASDPLVAGGVLVWIVYAILLHIRWSARLSGRKVAYLSVLGFILVLLTMLGAIVYVGAGVHKSL